MKRRSTILASLPISLGILFLNEIECVFVKCLVPNCLVYMNLLGLKKDYVEQMRYKQLKVKRRF